MISVDISRRLEKERKVNIRRILLPLIIMAGAGYFLYVLIDSNFFVGWEIGFAAACYLAILCSLFLMDTRIMWWLNYTIYMDDNKVKIRDGFFSRVITIPAERLYYINTKKLDDGRGNAGREYDSIFITDKKIHHNKIRCLSEEEFKDSAEHLNVVKGLEARYPDKKFYYYRVIHNGYKFYYYFYMLYRNCERCRFSSTSMELVKNYVNAR